MYATQEIQYAKCFYRAVKGTEFCTLSKQIFNFISGEVEKNKNKQNFLRGRKEIFVRDKNAQKRFRESMT